jgi:hypothetical protein
MELCVESRNAFAIRGMYFLVSLSTCDARVSKEELGKQTLQPTPQPKPGVEAAADPMMQ